MVQVTDAAWMALLRLWCRPATTAPIGPLAWESPYAVGAAIKRQKKKKLRDKSLIIVQSSPLATQHLYTPFYVYLNFSRITKATLFLPEMQLIVTCSQPLPQMPNAKLSSQHGFLGCADSSNSDIDSSEEIDNKNKG